MNHDDERDHAEEAAVLRDAVREGLAEQEAERAELLSVDAYVDAGVARVELRGTEDCDGDCDCGEGYCDDPEYHCDHCEVHCDCTPCEYASVA